MNALKVETLSLDAANENAPSDISPRNGGTVEQVTDPAHRHLGRDIPAKPVAGQWAEVVPGKSIRLFGVERNRIRGHLHYDRTFVVGDTVIYDSFNLVYLGTIVAIGARTITIMPCLGSKIRRLNIYQFNSRNNDLDLDATRKRNSEWYD